MTYSKATINRKRELVLIADSKPTKIISLNGVERLDIEITSDIFVALSFIDGREPQKYQVRKIDVKWLDMRGWRDKSWNKLRKGDDKNGIQSNNSKSYFIGRQPSSED